MSKKFRYYPLFKAKPDGFIYLIFLDELRCFKIGRAADYEGRLFWLTKDYGPISTIAIWQVPDMQFCEDVFLAMTRRYALDDSETRIIPPAEVSDVEIQFTQFVKELDDPANNLVDTINFVFYDADKGEMRQGELKGINKDWIRKVASGIKMGLDFSRPQLTTVGLSHNQYHKIVAAFRDAGFLKKLPGNRHQLTNKGQAFLAKF